MNSLGKSSCNLYNVTSMIVASNASKLYIVRLIWDILTGATYNAFQAAMEAKVNGSVA